MSMPPNDTGPLPGQPTILDPNAPPSAVTLDHTPSFLSADTGLAPLVEGSLFGKYILLSELGRGGMGVVYKARQTDLDRVVALKMILGAHLASAEQVARFQTEARAAARLRHAHIVQVYETDQIHGQHYFAMEYVEGVTLDRLIAKRPLSSEQAVELLLPVADAVAHLHAHGVLHRDLKPQNVLIDPSGRPVLTDFGLAKVRETTSDLTHSGAIVGTPSYMAPEQAAGRVKDLGPAADVYSLGAMLYHLLTGRPPFLAATPLDTLVQVLESEPVLPRLLNRAVPRKLELICLKCLDKNEANRYTDAAALRDDLRRFLDGEPVHAQPQGWPERFVRWARREPALAAHLGIIGLGSLLHEMGYRLAQSTSASVHLTVQSMLAVWAVLSWILQRWRSRGRHAALAPFVWAALDVMFLTIVLQRTAGLGGPLVILYPLYIAATGLWFQVRLVGWATLVSAVGYVTLMALAAADGELQHAHRHLIGLVALVVLGFITSYQVQRVRALSRFYEQRPGV